ncbi:hypothetical protein [Desulfobulbus sp.]|uniref:hypothetical protein n=1 Tax=Desulfobulbus sp. TaxID=895 RepID=UPI00286EB51D|nr:hypothetical protein [Desulfobulbus sp.]
MKTTIKLSLIVLSLLAVSSAVVIPTRTAPSASFFLYALSLHEASAIETSSQSPATIQVGPLEITPKRANLLLITEYASTSFKPTIQFTIKNISSADVRIILFKKSIEVTDDLGYSWFYNDRIKSGGIALSDQDANSFSKAFFDEKNKFVTISPKQTFEAQLLPGNTVSYTDKSHELIRTHRPKTVTLSANMGIINLDNSTDIRAFSFSDLQVQTSTR